MDFSAGGFEGLPSCIRALTSNNGAEDGIRTRDPHLGEVWIFVHQVVASPLASDSST